MPVCVCWAGLTRERERKLTREDIFYNCSTNMSQPGQEEDEMQRPEMSEEDLNETINKLGRSGPAKSKTTEVMQECEKVGKAAPSVFSGARAGTETVLNARAGPPIIRKKQ
ncbi:musculoskeletal embryonic nuclear protein 1a [Gymnodraco acuticeps]|uniref:Musculoskeletal embryonic nuclear protein 1 n=1 Tax=Gymnodraco acuticeps TaxID=8218 RepID=A0A6P8V341_GYMAC|nr:musculoskeletal embryonic nuclear protein 1a [Gymnodraco acuticeps]